MNIIMGSENAKGFAEKYLILELDTIKVMPDGHLIPAYCLVENVPILDMSRIESLKSLHDNLIKEYRKKNWNYCTQALEHLVGCWNSELDSFYADLSKRIDKYKEQDPGEDWDGTIEKHPVS